MYRPGDTVRFKAFAVDKTLLTGKSGLAAGTTVDIVDDAESIVVSGATPTEGAVAGWYYYAYAIPAGYSYRDLTGTFHFTSADVQQKDLPALREIELALTATRSANLDNLNASVAAITPGLVQRSEPDNTSIGTMAATVATNLDAKVSSITPAPSAATVAAAVWAYAAGTGRTLTSFGTLVADVAAAVWAAATRTLTSAAGLGQAVAAYVWDRLVSTPAVSGSVLERFLARLNLITSSSVAVVGNPVSGTRVNTHKGAFYTAALLNRLLWPAVSGRPDLTGGVVTVTLDSALASGEDAIFTGVVVSADEVGLDWSGTDSDSVQLGEDDSPGIYPYWLTWTKDGDTLLLFEGTWTHKRMR